MLFVVYISAAFVLRSVLQYRRTGDAGFRGISGPVGSSRWWTGALFVLALVTGVFGPVAALLGLEPIKVLTTHDVQVPAVVAAVVGIVCTVLAQLEMASSWRIGVREGEGTALVTNGFFAVVRNPIFTAMAITAGTWRSLCPTPSRCLGFALLLIALQLQVRVVEEPYLRALHGETYAAYEESVGRFVPLVGRRSTRT